MNFVTNLKKVTTKWSATGDNNDNANFDGKM